MRWLFLFILFMMFSVDFVSAEEKIDINSAPLADLVKIIHVGEARALELISLRPFSSLDDLMKIKGIGESRLADIKNQGLAWVDLSMAKSAEDSPPQPLPIASSSAAVKKSVIIKKEPVRRSTEKPVEVMPLQTENSKNFPLLIAAVFTSLFSGGIILILKKHVRT